VHHNRHLCEHGADRLGRYVYRERKIGVKLLNNLDLMLQ